MSDVVIPLVLLMNGLSAGVLVSTQLGGWPLLRSLPVEQYVYAHSFFSTRFDPFMPMCLVGTVLGDALLAVLGGPTAARWVFAVAGLCGLGTVVISLAKNVPLNRWVRTVDPADQPADLEQRRAEWGRWNQIRASLAALALFVNCIAVGVVLTGS